MKFYLIIAAGLTATLVAAGFTVAAAAHGATAPPARPAVTAAACVVWDQWAEAPTGYSWPELNAACPAVSA